MVINATACSTHLINDEAEAYDQQIELAIAISQWVIEGVPMFVVGDFNLETGGPPLNAHIGLGTGGTCFLPKVIDLTRLCATDATLLGIM